MKSLRNFAGTMTVSVTAILLTALSSRAQMQPSQMLDIPKTVTNALVTNTAREFFEAGREQLEAEVQLLMRDELAQTEELLTIQDDVNAPHPDSWMDEEP